MNGKWMNYNTTFNDEQDRQQQRFLYAGNVASLQIHLHHYVNLGQ
jgi:hypothetical protein